MMLRNFFLKTQNISRNIFFTILIFSCSKPNADSVNQNFSAKYGEESKKINDLRNAKMQDEFSYNEQKNSSIPKLNQIYAGDPFANPALILGVNGTYDFFSATINTSALKIKREENFLPDGQILLDGKNSLASERIPDDIFDLTYNTGLYPPFAMAGLEFDIIEIPERDAYGVSSKLTQKKYALAGNQALQKNIDLLLALRDEEEDEVSQILIEERKKLRREQRLKKIFGDEEVLATKSKKEKQLTKKEEDPLKKTISLQIIQQNLDNNKVDPAAAIKKN